MTDREKVLEEALRAVIVGDFPDRRCKLCGCYVDRNQHRPEACEVAAALAPPGPASEPEREHDCDDDPDCQLCHHVNAPKPAPPKTQLVRKPCVCEHWEGNHSPGCCFCGCMKYDVQPAQEALCRCYGDKFPLRDGCVPHASTPAPAAHVPPKGPRCGFRSRVIEAKCDMPEGHKGAHCDWVPLDAPDPDTLPRFSVRQVLDAVRREAVTTLDVFLGKEVEKVAVADLLRALGLSRREDT